MAQLCKTCHSTMRPAIEAEIAAGISLSVLERKYHMTRDALRRHREAHMSPSVVPIRPEKKDGLDEKAVAKTARDRVQSLLEKLEALVERTHDQQRESMLLGASRELRAAIELSAKLTGELRPDSSVNVNVVNLATSEEWQRTRAVILSRLQRHPEALDDVLDGLRQIAGSDATVVDVTPRSDGIRRLPASATVVEGETPGFEA